MPVFWSSSQSKSLCSMHESVDHSHLFSSIIPFNSAGISGIATCSTCIAPSGPFRKLTAEVRRADDPTPLQSVAADGELMMFRHTGFWQPMDTFREWKMLEEMWDNGTAEWRMWD